MHVAACGPWLVAEVDLVRPVGVLLLGATAGAAVFGPSFRVGEARGLRRDWPADTFGSTWVPAWVVATTHPSAVLRSRNRAEDRAAFAKDLRVVASLL
jgi:DNA polymerase